MKRVSFQYNGKKYEIYGKAEHLSVCHQPHIFDVEAQEKPHSQMAILKGYLLSNGFAEADMIGKNTHQLISKVKEYSMLETKKTEENVQSFISQDVQIERSITFKKTSKFGKIVEDFFVYIIENKIELYNEFSLQHELGIYLRSRLGTTYKVQFERNVNFFGIPTTSKHEIDIVIFNEKERYAIELKYPKNGQYPEQMFKFIQDIKFMEEVKKGGFQETYALSLVKDHNFYEGKSFGIYEYFRSNKIIEGKINGPTEASKGQFIQLDGRYQIEWKNVDKNFKYYMVEI